MARRPRSRNRLAVPDEQIEAVVAQFPDAFDPDTHRALFALRATAQRVNDCANEWLAPLGLTVGKYNYLVALASSKSRSRTLNEIGALIHTSSATVTGMIAALERDGLVERENNPADGRSTIARLTPSGEALLREVMPRHQRNIEASLKGFSREERRQLFALLLKLGAGFGPATGAVKRGRAPDGSA
jgi:DNA-binding MarR family transcriptional regulator